MDREIMDDVSRLKRTRQAGLVNETILHTPIHVIGVGGIGSFTTITLAKMGFSDITVYDTDTVEFHNLPNQFYREQDLHKPKVEALRDIVKDFEGIEIKTKQEKVTKETQFNGIVVLAVDNMLSRKAVFDGIAGQKDVNVLVDGRMGGNQLEVYTCLNQDKTERKVYQKRLITDEEAADVPCTMKAVVYNVATIASWISNQIRLALTDKPYNRMMILDLENMILISEKGKEIAHVR